MNKNISISGLRHHCNKNPGGNDGAGVGNTAHRQDKAHIIGDNIKHLGALTLAFTLISSQILSMVVKVIFKGKP